MKCTKTKVTFKRSQGDLVLSTHKHSVKKAASKLSYTERAKQEMEAFIASSK